MDILITGGCGFIGSNFVRYLLKKRRDVRVINIDELTYAGNLANLADVERDYADRYLFVKGDIAEKGIVNDIFERFEIVWVVNFAAESHVDRSVTGPEIFVRTNIIICQCRTALRQKEICRVSLLLRANVNCCFL